MKIINNQQNIKLGQFTQDTYLIMLSINQGGIEYYFLSFWYDTAGDWTLVSWAIGEHSTH